MEKKNCWLIPTAKPSRLYLGDNGNLILGLMKNSIESKNNDFTNQNIYITSDEEIKEGDWCIMTNDYGDNYLVRVISLKCIGGKEIRVLLSLNNQENTTLKKNCKKIILTTNPDLIKDGVQAIDNEFLEWFVENPNCEEVETFFVSRKTIGYDSKYKIIIPKEEFINPNNQELMFHKEHKEYFYEDFIDGKFVTVWLGKDYIPKEEVKQETLEDMCNKINFINPRERVAYYNGLENGAKWKQERSYSEEEVKNIIIEYQHYLTIDTNVDVDKWFEQLKK